MLQLLDTNLYVGDKSNANLFSNTEWAVVHATQTIHYQIMGWDRKYNKPPKNHPNYIVYEDDNRLSLNWVDGAARLYNWSGLETFINVLDFIDKWIESRKIYIHCDQGFSRSPSLALLYLAKRAELISGNSFMDAKADFVKIYPNYNPGGIAEYINLNWNEIK